MTAQTPSAIVSYAQKDDVDGRVAALVRALADAARSARGGPFEIVDGGDRAFDVWSFDHRGLTAFGVRPILAPLISPAYLDSAPCRSLLRTFLACGGEALVAPIAIVPASALAELERRDDEIGRVARLGPFDGAGLLFGAPKDGAPRAAIVELGQWMAERSARGALGRSARAPNAAGRSSASAAAPGLDPPSAGRRFARPLAHRFFALRPPVKLLAAMVAGLATAIAIAQLSPRFSSRAPGGFGDRGVDRSAAAPASDADAIEPSFGR